MLTTNTHQIVQILQHGGIVLFPTDTVWGMGCSLQRLDAIKRFYQIKGREKDKPTAVLVGSLSQAQEIAQFTPKAAELARVYWPGALTIVTHVRAGVPQEILGEQGAVGVRWPDFPLVQDLTQLLRAGIMTGSANFAGEAPPSSKAMIDQRLRDLVDGIFDGECGGQPPSTVVDATGEKLKVLRQGAVEISNVR